MVTETIVAVDVANGGDLGVRVQHINGEHVAIDPVDARGSKNIVAKKLGTSAGRLLQLDEVDKDVVECHSQRLVVKAFAAFHKIHASVTNNLVIEVPSKEANPLVFPQRGFLDASVQGHLVSMIGSWINMDDNELK